MRRLRKEKLILWKADEPLREMTRKKREITDKIINTVIKWPLA